MQYYSNPITEKEKISNALLSFDETEFDKLMETIHFEWFQRWFDRGSQLCADLLREAKHTL